MTTVTRPAAAPVAAGAGPAPIAERPAWMHLGWFAAGAAIGFSVPYVFTSVLSLHHDLYYLVYFAIVLAFLGAYVQIMDVDIVALFRRSWRWSLAIGVPATAFVVANVLSRDATPGPGGAYAVFEVAWRGIAYGVVDALLLTAFPSVVAFALLKKNLHGVPRRLLYAAIALPLILFATAVYHLGYEQFRDDGVGPPLTGNTIISVPMIATANPLGSIAAHASMHIAADIHAYETDIFLPPQTEAP